MKIGARVGLPKSKGEKMKLEVGQFYKRRDGSRVQIIGNAGNGTYPYQSSPETSGYMEDGSYVGTERESQRDIVAPWEQPPISLEVGKTYITNDGKRVKIIDRYTDSEVFMARLFDKGALWNWYRNGMFCGYSMDYKSSIVAEYTGLNDTPDIQTKPAKKMWKKENDQYPWGRWVEESASS